MTPIDNKLELARPVRDRADALGLNDEEHRLLARWLAEAGPITAIPAAAQRRRRRVLCRLPVPPSYSCLG